MSNTSKNKFLRLGEELIKSITNLFKSESKTEYSDCIIQNEKGQILLLHRTYTDDFMNGKWGFPGGHVDEGEDAWQAATREVQEETGLKVIIANEIAVKEMDDCVIHYHQATVTGIVPGTIDDSIILDNEEHRGYEWVDRDKVSQYDLIANLSTYVDELIAKLHPITIISRPVFTNVEEKIAEIGGGPSLEECWEVLCKAFNENKISEEQYLVARNNYLKAKRKEAIDVIAKGLDNGMVTEEEYMDVVHKGGKPAVLGERRMFGNKEYEKGPHGWRPVPKGGQQEKKEQPKKVTTPAAEHWWSGFKKYQLNCYPIGIDQSKVDVDESGDVDSHWILRWKDPKSGAWKNAYSKEFMNRNAAEKWNRIQNVSSKQIEQIKQKATKMMLDNKAPQPVRDAAAIIAIIAHTGLRRGDKAKLEKSGNRGVSTLLPDNVEVVGGTTVKFNFIGKSYQENNAEINDASIASYITHRKNQEASNQQEGNLLFHTTDAIIDATFDQVGGEGLKIKDMRTYVASDLARQLLFEDKTPPPPVPQDAPKTQVKKLVKEKLNGVYEKVAEKLNNTPTMAKNSYIHPNIIDFWIKKLNLSFDLQKSEDVAPLEGTQESSYPSLDEIIASYPRYIIEETDTMNPDDEEDCDTFNEPEWLDDELVD